MMKLDPCPRCAGAAIMVRKDLDERVGYGAESHVRCTACHIRTDAFISDPSGRGGGYHDKESADRKAAKAWNRA